jgi:hypothetical protein
VDGFNLTDENFHTTFVYSVSGTFSYSGSKTGWVYVNVINEWDWPTGEGTSIEVKYKEPGSESWDFTVRGVRPGNYTLTARMDTIGLSNPVASMPSGSSGVFMVEASDITGLSITLEDPAPITPEAPAIMEAFPSNQSAWIVYETPHDDDDNEIAQSYNVYWSTDPGVSKASNEGEGSVPAGDMDFLIASGLTDGEEYYFVMTAVANGTESVESETFGPVKIGAATGDWTVSGTITYSQAATGPMYVLLYGEAAARATYIASPTSSQPYSISGVPEGTYMFAVLVDMNDNGYMEWTGDIHVGFEGEIEIEVSGNTTQDLSIGFLPNASVVAATSHWKDSWGEGYGLDFKIESMLKQVVKASLVSGPGIPGVIDIGFMHGDWEGIGLDFYTTSPGVGDTYTFDFTYSDGTTESLQASVTAVLDSFATPISPIGDVFGPTATHPTFEWAPPDPPPLSYGYDIDVWEFMGGHIWWADEIPSSETSVEFNFNDEAEQDPLFPGVPYQWSITVIDDYGNSASSGSVEFTPW